ncbi:TonB-dependent receptor [Glaciecola sp. 1036]|uniref:TonB-dependent receptor n=1 Tax=Alteromonadaceae TaxID=72275 RepID=UPI003CFDB882
MKQHKLNNLTRGLRLAFAVGAITATTAPFAVAQESTSETEIIEISGIRASQEANINTKRFSNSIVDAITAEDIGKFPDKNVAESLSRIPGITIDRDFGEGQGVTIRGVQPDQNLTLVNGQAVGTAQWFVLSDATRNFNFEILASEMVAGLEVYKSSQADLDEGALGGTVILRTRKPLELDANTAQVSVEAQYNDIAEETDPSLSGLYSWKNDEGTFGILVSGSYQQRTVHRETNEDFGWFGPSIPRIDPLVEAPQGASEKGAIPWGMGSALFKQDRKRQGIDVTAQWLPTDDLDISVHYLSSKMEADNVNSNLIGIPFRGVAYMGTDTNSGTVSNNIVESLAVTGLAQRPAWARHMAYDNIFRDGSEMSTEILDLEGKYTLESGELHFQLGTTTGEGTNRDFFTEFWVTPDDERANFDFYNPGGASPYIDFTTASPWLANPDDEMWLGGIFDQANLTEDEENYLQIDYSHFVEWGAITEIKSGFKIRDRSFGQHRYRTDLANLAPTGDGSLGPASDFWTGDMVHVEHSQTNGVAASYFMPDKDSMYNALYAVSECNDANAASLCRTTDVYLKDASFDIEEDITALYVMAKFDTEGLRGNLGLRYVETDTTSMGFDLNSGDAVSFDGDYNEWLPSANIAYDVSEDVVLRFAAARVITRPAPFQLAPAVNLTPETSSGTAGNPALNPLTANQFEAGVEWYFDSSSLASVTLFKKDISDFIFTKTVSREINGQQINQLSTPENGGSTSLEGFEFQIQHAFENGFGGYFNYTYTEIDDAEIDEAAPVLDDAGNIIGATLATRTVSFPRTSKNSYNIGVYYENDVYSARLNYNYRSEYFLAQAEIGDTYRDDQSQLDAQFSWHFNDNLTFKAEALNLTDEIWENYYVRSSDGARLGGTQSANGRRIFVGASYSF